MNQTPDQKPTGPIERSLPLTAHTSAEPGKTVQLVGRLEGAAEIDRVEIDDPDAVPTLLTYGPHQVRLKDGESLEQALSQAETRQANQRSYVTLVVLNQSDETRPISARVVLKNERPMSVQPNSKVTPGAVARPTTTPARVQQRAAAVRRPRSSSRVFGENTALKASQPFPPEQKLIESGSRAVLLVTSHAEGIARLLEHHVPIHRGFRHPLAFTLDQALGCEEVPKASAGQIVLVMSITTLRGLATAVRHKGFQMSQGDRDAVLRGIATALEGQARGVYEPVDVTLKTKKISSDDLIRQTSSAAE